MATKKKEGTENKGTSVKFGKITKDVIEELRTKPTGDKATQTAIITDLVETNPKFISKLNEMNKRKKAKK